METFGLPTDYTYSERISGESSMSFQVKEIVDESSCKVWLEKLSDITQVTWRLLRSYANSGKINVYKVDLRCQHNTDQRAQGTRTSKNTNCPAKMSIVVRRYLKKSKSTKEPDPMIKEFPTVITVKENHNHALGTAAVLKYRDLSPAKKEKFLDLFRHGHNPSSALHSHKLDLMMEYEENYYRVAADGQFLPSISVVTKLFEAEFKKKFGESSGNEISDTLESLLNDYTKQHNAKAGYQYTKDGEHYFVVLCTPIMLRVHETIVQASEVVMIDASGGVDKQRHRIYFLVTPTAAGGLPLGVIISDSEKESVFLEALLYFKDLVGNCAFNFKLFPQIFITDNDLKEISAIGKVFPQSTTLLCQFHMLKAVWSWLCDHNHNIKKEDRQEIYFMFKKILYSFSADSANEAFNKLVLFAITKDYGNLNKYLQNLWKNKEKWISCYRNMLPLRGNNTTNYVEIVFRILKDCILNRTMAFNLTQLVDFILTRYEMYLKQRLTDFGNGRYSSSLLKKMLPFKTKETDIYSVEQQSLSDLYDVKTDSEHHVVDIVRGMSSCGSGSSGRLCKHSSAVIFSSESDVKTAYNLVCSNTKRDMLYVAGGVMPPLEWFLPLDRTIDTQYNTTIPETPSDQIPKELENESERIDSTSLTDCDELPTLSEEEEHRLEELFSQIRNGVESNPSIFVPAVRKMLKNAKSFAKTESGLVSALHTFGSYSGLKSSKENKNAKTKSRRCHKSRIGVQPTAIGRRKYCLPGKRRVGAGRPSGQKPVVNALESHRYTTFGYLPSRKRKAPHNLQNCVEDNKSLGVTKHAKI